MERPVRAGRHRAAGDQRRGERAAVRALPRPRGRGARAPRRRALGPVAGRSRGHPVRPGPRSTTRRREPVRTEPLPVATLGYSLREEREAVGWVHQEVSDGKSIPLLEAYGVVRSLSLAMHGGQAMVMPLLQLKEFDQYTTTHSMNVSVLTMALGEFLGMAPTAVRGFGLAGLLHDLGKVRIPQGDPVQAGQAHARGARGGRGPSRRWRPDDPRGQRAARSGRRRGLRAPPLPRRRRLSARPLPAGLPPGEPPGARLRRVRRPPHAPALPRRLVLDRGARRTSTSAPARSSTRRWPRRSSR